MLRRFILALVLCALAAHLWPAPSAGAAPLADVPPPDRFQLPFPIGDTWTFNGVHGARRDAIDFSVGRPWPRWRSNTDGMWVVAAAAGTVRKTSSCGLEIDHGDGWTTVYYHIEHIMRDSGQVQANEHIANIANTPREALCEGGAATGPHLHFGLKHNGQEVPIDGLVLSGWRIHSGRGGYDSSCARMYLERGEQRLCAYTGALRNEGLPGAAPNLAPAAAQAAPHAEIEIDALAEQAGQGDMVSLQGWAIDPAGPESTGVDHIHLYLDGPAGQGQFLAEAPYHIKREDVARAFGDERYSASGFFYNWQLDALAPGQHTLFVYAHSTASDWTYVTRSITIAP